VTRAVVDTSVLVSAFVGDPAAGPAQLVDAWREQRFMLVVSPLLLAELGEVLARPKLERWSSEGRGEAYAASFAARSEQHSDPQRSSPSEVSDPGDDYLVALMRSSEADLLVSLDRDLLDAQLPNIIVLYPAKFLDHLSKTQP
jgi:putative PIN family toxin of toxin-antitoxin system